MRSEASLVGRAQGVHRNGIVTVLSRATVRHLPETVSHADVRLARVQVRGVNEVHRHSGIRDGGSKSSRDENISRHRILINEGLFLDRLSGELSVLHPGAEVLASGE